MSCFITLKTGVVLGKLLSNCLPVCYFFPVQGKKDGIPAIFTMQNGGVILLNGSMNESDLITMTTPCFAHQRPYSVSVMGRRGVDVTKLFQDISQSGISELQLTANAVECVRFAVCAKALKVVVIYNEIFLLGEYITAEFVSGIRLVLRSTQQPFSSVSEIRINNMGDRATNIYGVCADENGIVTVTLPLTIVPGDCVDLWLTAYLI